MSCRSELSRYLFETFSNLQWRHMDIMASQIFSNSILYSTVCSGTHQRKHQSSALLAFVRGTHGWPVDSPHKGPVTRKYFHFSDDVIMTWWYTTRDIMTWKRFPHNWPFVRQPTGQSWAMQNVGGVLVVGLDRILNKQSRGRWNAMRLTHWARK